MDHQNLAIAIRPGSNADRGNAQITGNLHRQFARHGFQHHGERTRSFHGARIANQLFRRVRRLPLHAVTAERIHRLGRQPHMAHHRNFRFRQPRNQLKAAFPTFDLHRFCSGFFHKAHGIAQRFCCVGVVAAVRHVRNEQRAPRAAPHRARVVQHIV